jgi:hypothetical protein
MKRQLRTLCAALLTLSSAIAAGAEVSGSVSLAAGGGGTTLVNASGSTDIIDFVSAAHQFFAHVSIRESQHF